MKIKDKRIRGLHFFSWVQIGEFKLDWESGFFDFLNIFSELIVLRINIFA